MTGQIWRRLQLLFSVGRGVLAGRERVQVTGFTDDDPPAVRWVEPYGFSYFPPGGGEVYMLFPNGDRSRGFFDYLRPQGVPDAAFAGRSGNP